jgi:hypothetical protein
MSSARLLNSGLGPLEQCWVDNRELRGVWWYCSEAGHCLASGHWFPSLLFSVRQSRLLG